MVEKAIDITVVVFPDASTIFFDEQNPEYLKQCIDSWRASLPAETQDKYENAGACMVAGRLRMLREDYKRIVATNSFPWPVQAGRGEG